MAKAKTAKSIKTIYKEKSERLMEGVAYWASFYRKNPQRFAKDYLNMTLKPFQKILIYCMMMATNLVFIASRGLGKTWLVSLYMVIRCILYPGTKIIVASGFKAQSLEIIQKIKDDFMKNYGWGSTNLCFEIEYISDTVNKAECIFKNGSFIRIVTASDSARHNRANVIFVDEYRMVDKSIVETVLKKFLTAPRQPGYLNKPEYSHLIERNVQIYASSAFYASHWCFERFKSYFANMLDDNKKYFCVDLPYQIAIKENLLSREQVEDEMSEVDFDPISWEMEMCGVFLGSNGDEFFKYNDVANRRKIKTAFYPLEIYKNHHISIPELMYHERRILSVDVALLSSKKNSNDASALWINSAIPTDNNDLISNFVYAESHEGLTTDELGLIIMRTFYQYKCTDLVLDTRNAGVSVYDFLIKPQYDPEYGVTYDAMTSINDSTYAERCKIKGANKVIWCINATADFNSSAAQLLRAGFLNGNINLLRTEVDIEDELKKIRGYKQFTKREQDLLRLPYVQTTLLINELINLEHETKGVNIRVYERSGMRKDRYSSIMMNYKICLDLAIKQRPKKDESKLCDMLPIVNAKRIRAY